MTDLMIKKNMALVLVVGFLFVATRAQSGEYPEPVQPGKTDTGYSYQAQGREDSACAILICLSTKNLREGGRPCLMAQKEFFKIVKYEKHSGKTVVDLPGTIRKRTERLRECTHAKKHEIATVIGLWGAVIRR